jgi:hypothetical protein
VKTGGHDKPILRPEEAPEILARYIGMTFFTRLKGQSMQQRVVQAERRLSILECFDVK